MIAVLIIALIVPGVLAVVALGLRTLRAVFAAHLTRVDERLGTVDGTLGGMEEKLDRRLSDIDQRVDRRLESLDGRLLATQRSQGEQATQITERLGRLDGTATQMLERANDLSRLQEALRPPKARGGVGELLLANLLRDCLPPDAYSLQHTFKTGERVDAVVRVDQLVPIDAKFPLDNFERLANAQEESDKTLYERALTRDVKGHMDAISAKYIRPGEGTYDFALMYLPSESVYYELTCGRSGELVAYGRNKRVFPVSPTTLHAYLQVILLGLKGMQIERHAQEVWAYCAQLRKDFERFRTDFDVIGRHIGNAQSKYGEAERRLDRLGLTLDRAAEWEPDAVDADPTPERALEAV